MKKNTFSKKLKKATWEAFCCYLPCPSDSINICYGESDYMRCSQDTMTIIDVIGYYVSTTSLPDTKQSTLSLACERYLKFNRFADGNDCLNFQGMYINDMINCKNKKIRRLVRSFAKYCYKNDWINRECVYAYKDGWFYEKYTWALPRTTANIAYKQFDDDKRKCFMKKHKDVIKKYIDSYIKQDKIDQMKERYLEKAFANTNDNRQTKNEVLLMFGIM